ncbi:ATP-binding protein [Desulfonatronum thiodismutans]|uniref:ATP-binding protein n=1 Tax=Desulfonatronum thiodismutans TaxID=159290 RepID=UPI0004ABD603|nr:ATP-binding protein [Desulfonatronum thiodismutans]
MKLKDMRIRTQIRLGMGAILLLVATLAALAWFQTDQLWRQTKVLYEHPLEVRRAIGELKADVLTIHWAMEELFAHDTPRNVEHILALITAHEANARAQFDILFDRYSGDRADVEVLFLAVEGCRANREEVLRLFRAENIDTARAANIHKEVGPDTPHLREVMGLLRRVDDISRDYADHYYRTASIHHRTMTAKMVFSVAAIILMTATIGYFLYAWISRPLRDLTDLTRRFREGDFGVRGRSAPANEFGTLEGAFNQMAESISSQMDLRNINDHISEILLNANDLPTFRKELLNTLMEATDSQMGAYFKRNPSEDVFEPFVSIGVDRERLKAFDASTLEGEIGKVLTTGKMVRLRDIPGDSVFHFRTFAGSLPPKELISFPIILDDGVRGIQGVISLASIKGYAPKAIEILSLPWATLVHTVFANLVANDRTRRLSEELLESNQELQVQQEELHAQAEELQAQNEELHSQAEELELQRQAVEEVARLKSQFLSNMSHELRTPLNSVMALSRVLMMQARSKLSKEEASYLEIIERNGKNLLALINDILDLSKIEAGRMDVYPKPFALGRTLENVVESIMPLAREKRIDLHHDIPADLPTIESDELRITQVLQNLLGNAVKFTDTGGVSVSVRADREKVFLRVTDTGIGITKNDLPHIFDEFRQADGSSSRRHEGTGLGLAIAQKSARLLGGDISVESAPGKGSTFTLTLPLVWQGAALIHEPVSMKPLSKDGIMRSHAFVAMGERSHQPRILLVEDNEAAIIQVRSVLETAGYAVDVARDGREALDFVALTIPDGIVLDLMMPQVDGFAVLEKIRSTSATASIPVLVLTAKDLTSDDLKRLSANSIQQLVQKGDVDRESLLSKVSAMVGGMPRGMPGASKNQA